MSAERRRHKRYPLGILVQHQLTTEDGFEVDYTADVSHGGLFVRSHRAPPPDATMHVQFAPQKGAQMVSAFCRVTHVTPEGFGAEFIGLDTDSVAFLDAALLSAWPQAMAS